MAASAASTGDSEEEGVDSEEEAAALEEGEGEVEETRRMRAHVNGLEEKKIDIRTWAGTPELRHNTNSTAHRRTRKERK